MLSILNGASIVLSDRHCLVELVREVIDRKVGFVDARRPAQQKLRDGLRDILGEQVDGEHPDVRRRSPPSDRLFASEINNYYRRIRR